MLTFDLKTADEDTLTKLAALDLAAVAEERDRRAAFQFDADLFSALAQARVDLETRFELVSRGSTAKFIQASGIVELLRRAVVTAKRNGIEVADPVVPVIEAPVFRKERQRPDDTDTTVVPPAGILSRLRKSA